jgi:hypothetical protein
MSPARTAASEEYDCQKLASTFGGQTFRLQLSAANARSP